MNPRHFPTSVASRLTGVSPGTLENWALRGFLRPSAPRASSRDPRMYSFQDLIAIRIADALRQRGIDVRHLRRVVAYLRARHGLDLVRFTVEPDTLLMTDGTIIYEADASRALATLVGEDRALVVVPFGRMVTRLRDEARAAA
jgi:DNA-binding transcriptional MerR regulator